VIEVVRLRIFLDPSKGKRSEALQLQPKVARGVEVLGESSLKMPLPRGFRV